MSQDPHQNIHKLDAVLQLLKMGFPEMVDDSDYVIFDIYNIINGVKLDLERERHNNHGK